MPTDQTPPTLDELAQARRDVAWLIQLADARGSLDRDTTAFAILQRIVACLSPDPDGSPSPYLLVKREDAEDVVASVDEIDGGKVDARRLLGLTEGGE